MIASDDGLSVVQDFPVGEADQIATMAVTALDPVAERPAIGSLAESVFHGRSGYLRRLRDKQVKESLSEVRAQLGRPRQV